LRVARYLHGLRIPIQDVLVVHTFHNVAEAQAKAKVMEKQLAKTRNFSRSNNIYQASSASNNSTNINRNKPLLPSPKPNQNTLPKSNQNTPKNSKTNIHCHNCRDLGHYARECPKP
jgi:Zinc knuckle